MAELIGPHEIISVISKVTAQGDIISGNPDWLDNTLWRRFGTSVKVPLIPPNSSKPDLHELMENRGCDRVGADQLRVFEDGLLNQPRGFKHHIELLKEAIMMFAEPFTRLRI